jgi:heme/copper-type cytochrome/quinol oxidase subunit 2
VMFNANELELNVGQLINQNVSAWDVLTSMWTTLGLFKIF